MKELIAECREEQDMQYNEAIAYIKECIREARMSAMFTATEDPTLVESGVIHLVVANHLKDKGFDVTYSNGYFTVSGWDKI
jgi:hypothetical protein